MVLKGYFFTKNLKIALNFVMHIDETSISYFTIVGGR